MLFHSSEYFALMVVGLSAIAAFAGSGQVTKALLMTFMGLVLATVGEGAQFNMPRFTMGLMDLQSGIGFITLAMAMFAIPETLFLVLDPKRSEKSAKILRKSGSPNYLSRGETNYTRNCKTVYSRFLDWRHAWRWSDYRFIFGLCSRTKHRETV